MADRFKRVALVNPPWDFQGSRYWACTEPHLPLELLYAQALLRAEDIEATVVDSQLEELGLRETADRVGDLAPDLIVVTTAPSYLFWRCPPPELTVPAALSPHLKPIAPLVAVGPHGSATPGYALDRLGCWAVVRGEPEEELLRLAQGRPTSATVKDGIAASSQSEVAAVLDLSTLPALTYESYPLERKTHRHHLFWGEGQGAEVEFSRGCPYGCSFCNRRFFRHQYRERPVERVMAELRRLRARGVDYVYFIDELFGLGRCDRLLAALEEERAMSFGCETRLDLWDEARLDRLADAGCVSVEFGLESPFPEVQSILNKGYNLQPDRILELMVYAKTRIPWVQADLVEPPVPDPDLLRRTEEWRQEAIGRGVWVSEPVKLFPYPGSELHEELLGPIHDGSWEAARELTCGC